jgi:hypothetical protein
MAAAIKENFKLRGALSRRLKYDALLLNRERHYVRLLNPASTGRDVASEGHETRGAMTQTSVVDSQYKPQRADRMKEHFLPWGIDFTSQSTHVNVN